MPAHPLTSDEGLQDAARSTLRELLSVSKRYRSRRLRLDSMFLFAGRNYKRGRAVKTVPKSEVVYDDCPEMELMLKHRDGYDALTKTLDDTREAIEKVAKNIAPDDPFTLLKLMAAVVTLEKQRDRHLEAIQEILGQLSRELMAQEAVLAKVVAEGAKLASLAVLTRERISAQMEATGNGIESKSNSELTQIAKDFKKRLASGESVVGGDDEGEEAD